MTTRSGDEVRDDHISAMGVELGARFYELDKKLIELHLLWQQYRQLFGDDQDTIELLNRTSGLFFRIVQDELWDSVILGISRMTDPPLTGNKLNLTVQSLPPLIVDGSIQAEIQILCNQAVDATAFAREHRNKRIAHQDHNYLINRKTCPLSGISRASVEQMLSSLRAILNRLHNHYRDSTVMYEDFIDESGAWLLISKLRKLERLDRET